MVGRLFDIDSYIKEFTASVLSCKEGEGGYLVTLDRTAFFPEGGGQGGDTGALNGAAVLDTQAMGGTIVHITDKPVSGLVKGVIDWRKRFCRMQNHTAEHIMSGIICSKYGCDNVGFRLGDGIVTMDYNCIIPEKDIKALQRLANEAVWQNLPVYAGFPENFKELTYRSKLDLTENVRIVTIPGVDSCACCAPHVSSTGQIGLIKVLYTEKNKGGTRFYMRAGEWALEEFDMLAGQIGSICALTSRPKEKTSEGVSALIDENKSLNYEIRSLKLKLLEKTVGDSPYCITGDASMLKEAVNILKERFNGCVAAFAGNDLDGYRFMLLYETDEQRESFCRELNASGGGRNGMLNGITKANCELIDNFFKKIK